MITSKSGRWERDFGNYANSESNVIEHPSRLPTHDEIEVRAYEIYLRTGQENGHCEEHWLEAERELMEEMRNGHEEDVTVAGGVGAL
jgi:Protein of unknown function (DUF2934)